MRADELKLRISSKEESLINFTNCGPKIINFSKKNWYRKIANFRLIIFYFNELDLNFVKCNFSKEVFGCKLNPN